MKRFVDFLENFLTVIILLSIVQIIIDDIAVINLWSENFSMIMIFCGLAFDIIFSIEFIIRSIVALKNRKFLYYFLYEKGWIDFVASIPLLATNSGPLFYLAITGKATSGARSIVNVLKVIKAIRVTRILRLLRTLKIFGKIENIYSKMSQHHISNISSLVVSISVAIYLLITSLGFLDFGNIQIEAKISLAFTIIIIVNVIAIAFFYSKHFAQNISDPIYVIKRGMIEDDYNFAVKIRKPYKDEEVFELVKVYNETWLPMKTRIQAIRAKKRETSTPSNIEINDDYSDLL